MPELLLELLSEEIPARMQARAAEDLQRLVTDALKKAGLDFDGARAYVTPRRLALVVEGLPEKQPDTKEERKGPKVGAPEQALQGFLRSAGLESVEQCEIREIKGAEHYFVVTEKKGGPVAALLAELLGPIVWSFPWPKSMRWSEGRASYVRPLHRVLFVFDGKPVEGQLEGDGQVIAYGNETVGHRFLSPNSIAVESFADYRDKLRAAHVILGRDQRRFMISEQANALTKAEGLSVKEAQALLDEVAGLVEWPEVLLGGIDEDFMDLPPEVLSISMSHHQKYFSTLDADGRLANRFLVVANMPVPEGSAIRDNIIAGNERVLRARLADARFFWDQDRKRSLASRAPALAEIVFHAKLGSLDQKVDRVQALAGEIAKHIPGADLDRVRSAARLAKADLTTGMVGEFPELQGVMGRYYALADGEHAEVAEAIAEHYSPLGPNDDCPSAPVSVAVALADKIDTLVGFWAIDEKPTGSKDPFALRRAALGVIRLIVENRLRLPLTAVLLEAVRSFASEGPPAAVVSSLLDFCADRMKVALKDQGVRHDLISAVFSLSKKQQTDVDGLPGNVDLIRVLNRVTALEQFLGSDDGKNLLIAYRRASNIVRIEQEKDEREYGDFPDPDRLVAPEEIELNDALSGAWRAAEPKIESNEFAAAMQDFATLRSPVDRFFENVRVNADDRGLRENRLRLLHLLQWTMNNVADFSHIEG